MTEAEQDDRATRRDRYERVLSTVAAKTSPAQGATARRAAILAVLCRADHDPDGVRSAIRAGVENDDLLQYRADDGTVRLARTDAESLEAALLEITDGDAEALLRVIEVEAARESPNKDVIATCNRLLAEVGEA